MGGAGTRAPESIYDPNPFAPIDGYALAAERRHHRREDERPSPFRRFDVANIGKLQLSGGLRVENYDTEYRSMAVTGIRTDVDAADTVVSGKAGVALPGHPDAERLRLLRLDGHAAGLGQLRAEHAAEQRQQPQRRSAGVAQLRGRGQVGPVPPPPVGDGGAVRHPQRERHLHHRRHCRYRRCSTRTTRSTCRARPSGWSARSRITGA